ncbi:MAG: AEC family transporter [Cellulomonadaceae bacterium]|jgi:predicted permease|nr:AEC family transporter [Cellulomonadaceae bacterium]
MIAILTGFTTIGIIIAVGYGALRCGVVGTGARDMLTRLAFFIAMPALLVNVVAEADLGDLLRLPLFIQVIVIAVAAGIFLLANRLWLRLKAPEATIGTYAASYINAANIGIPVAVYVLGDPAATVPLMLLQSLLLGPLAIMLLDLLTAGRVSWRFVLTQPLRNPIILAAIIGVVLSLTGWRLPYMVDAPLRLVGGAAIPMQLLAFGMSLSGARLLGPQSARRAAAVAALVKVVVMPVLAFVVARFVFRLDDVLVFSAVVLAGLPTAQNVYNYAGRFRRGEILARDTILLTTVMSPVVFIIAAALLR